LVHLIAGILPNLAERLSLVQHPKYKNKILNESVEIFQKALHVESRYAIGIIKTAKDLIDQTTNFLTLAGTSTLHIF